MNSHVKIETIQKIAKAKGLDFQFSEADNSYFVTDKLTGLCLMTYAPITVQCIVHADTWREEFNKLRAQSFR